MKVRVTIDVSEDDRIAIAALTGSEPIASHASVESWIRATVRATLDDIGADHEASLADEG